MDGSVLGAAFAIMMSMPNNAASSAAEAEAAALAAAASATSVEGATLEETKTYLNIE